MRGDDTDELSDVRVTGHDRAVDVREHRRSGLLPAYGSSRGVHDSSGAATSSRRVICVRELLRERGELALAENRVNAKRFCGREHLLIDVRAVQNHDLI